MKDVTEAIKKLLKSVVARSRDGSIAVLWRHVITVNCKIICGVIVQRSCIFFAVSSCTCLPAVRGYYKCLSAVCVLSVFVSSVCFISVCELYQCLTEVCVFLSVCLQYVIYQCLLALFVFRSASFQCLPALCVTLSVVVSIVCFTSVCQSCMFVNIVCFYQYV